MTTTSCPTQPIIVLRRPRPTPLERGAKRIGLAVMLWARRRQERRIVDHVTHARMIERDRAEAERRHQALGRFDRPLG